MPIASILAAKGNALVRVSPETPIAAVTEILHRNNIGAVLVMRGEELLGVLSDRGIVRAMALNPAGVRAMPAEQAMKPRRYETTPSATLEDALRLMTEHHVRYLPVFDAGLLVGVVSIGDVVAELLDRKSATVESLTAYIGQA